MHMTPTRARLPKGWVLREVAGPDAERRRPPAVGPAAPLPGRPRRAHVRAGDQAPGPSGRRQGRGDPQRRSQAVFTRRSSRVVQVPRQGNAELVGIRVDSSGGSGGGVRECVRCFCPRVVENHARRRNVFLQVFGQRSGLFCFWCVVW